MPFGLGKQSTIELKKKVPSKKHLKGSTGHSLKQSLKSTLGKGVNMEEAVRLPHGEDKDEWIAMNITEIFNSTNLSYGLVSDFCNETTCPAMTAGPKYKYLWEDPKTHKEPVSVPAYEYVDLLSKWCTTVLDDETIFPRSGKYGKNFLPAVKKMMKRLARVYFHIYHHHWEQVRQLNAEGHVNTCFKHFFYFAKEFDLMKEADMEPVHNIVTKLAQK